MPVDLSSFAVSGTNDPDDQVSVDYQNSLLATLESGINAASSSGGPFVNVADYLDSPRTEFVTDDLPAFEAALAALNEETGSPASGRLIVPAGRYYCSDTLNIHGLVHVIGEGSGQGSGAATIIRFGNNCNGIVVNYATTHGDGLGTQGDATGATLEGLQLWGGNVDVNGSGVVTSYYSGDSLTGHGVRIRAPFVECRDVMCAFFGEDGFNINCSSGGGDDVTGNANNFTLWRCQSIYNRRYAYLTNGLDANSGTVISCSAISCQGGGFIEYSFLGNSYFGLHIRECGTNPGTDDAPTGTALHAAASWRVMPGQEAAASTTEPGTDATVWAPTTAAATRTWTSGKTWAVGAPFATNPANANGRNVVIGLYTEDGMIPIAATEPSIVMGGLHENSGWTGTAGFLHGRGGGLDMGSLTLFRNGQAQSVTVGYRPGTNTASSIMQIVNATGTWNIGTSPFGVSDSINFVLTGYGEPFTISSYGAHTAGAYYQGGTKVVGAQGAAVADATDAATAITQLNALLARLRAHGLIAT